jgi:2-(1,2-epoxy-1,2-dihydrophenyl)acetyl-CoA isomerase
MADEVLYDVRDGVATLTLNRPDRLNAQNTALFELALHHLDRAAADDAVRVVVITGAGRGFSAGGDLSQMDTAGAEPPPFTAQVRSLRELTRTSQLLHEMPKVTIAAINGACAGGGMSWAMACDLRYAATSARFTTAFVNAGLSGDFGITWFLPRVVGSAVARQLLFFADVLSAEEARSVGMVNDVFADDALMAEVRARAAQLVAKAPLALARLKANLNDAEQLDVSRHLEIESERLIRTIHTADRAEAAAAFFEKRPAVFRGR